MDSLFARIMAVVLGIILILTVSLGTLSYYSRFPPGWTIWPAKRRISPLWPET